MLTLAFGTAVLTGAAAPSRTAKFDTIDVQRINARPPDGTALIEFLDKAGKVTRTVTPEALRD